MREFVKHVHFVGIGGIGMSGIAEVLLDLGFKVSGSDMNGSSQLEQLRKAGAIVTVGHAADNICGADVVVVSSAVSKDNVELKAAEENKIPVVPRAEMLGELMRFRKGIAVAGTHGKTTTTSLVASVLVSAGMDPTFVVGGVVNSVNTNARLGKGEYMVVEADESDASFFHLQPQMAVITNIDRDHMETYGGDFNKLQEAYIDFLHNLPFYGLCVLCFDDPVVRGIVSRIRKPLISYGFVEGVDFRAIGLRQKGTDSFFQVEHNGASLGEFRVPMPGKHNVLNALVAIAIGYKLALPQDTIRRALTEFEGIGRRFELLGSVSINSGRVDLVDDYAHHPRELATTLQASDQCWPDRRIVVVFQPHRYSRTRDLFEEFAQLLSKVEHLVVTEIYPAGEARIDEADGRALCQAIRKHGKAPIFADSLPRLRELLPDILRDGDVLLTLGAGDIGRFSQSLLQHGLLKIEDGTKAPCSSPDFMQGLRGKLLTDEPMARHTRWRVGGRADYFYIPADKEDLIQLLRQLPESIRPYWIGLGSNLLVRDGGVEGLVVRTAKGLSRLRALPAGRLYVEAGVSCAKVARVAVKHQLTGVEFLSGVPGSFGGAMAMNAGAFGGEIWDWIEQVECVDRMGNCRSFDAGEIVYGYREVRLPEGYWILSGTLKLDPAESDSTGRHRIASLLERRNATQPVQSANAGSVFKNPSGDFAGRLIEQAGLKGCREGGAIISRTHANFIINEGKATSKDIETLIDRVCVTIQKKFNVQLKKEVRVIGKRLDHV